MLSFSISDLFKTLESKSISSGSWQICWTLIFSSDRYLYSFISSSEGFLLGTNSLIAIDIPGGHQEYQLQLEN